jgi:hypothetical protein
VIAHVSGVPVEEALLPAVTGLGAALVLARVWASAHLRRHRRPRPDPPT